jgi:hypothetical protein
MGKDKAGVHIDETGEIMDEPLVSLVRRLLCKDHSRIRIKAVGRAIDAFGNNAA